MDLTEVRDAGNLGKDGGSECGWVLGVLKVSNNQNLVLNWIRSVREKNMSRLIHIVPMLDVSLLLCLTHLLLF